MQDQETALTGTLGHFERAVFLILLVSTVLAFLFVAGTVQGFAARTQGQLLFALQSTSAIGAIGSAISSLFELVIAIARRQFRRIPRCFVLIVLATLFGIAAIGATGALVFFEGTR